MENPIDVDSLTISEDLYRCRSQDRCETFLDCAETADDREFWAALRFWWSCFDRIDHPEMVEAMKAHGRDPFRKASDLPRSVMLYRGQSGLQPTGISWTTDYQIACSFAQGHRGIPVPDGQVVPYRARRAEIAFMIGDRSEAEAVLREIPVFDLSEEEDELPEDFDKEEWKRFYQAHQSVAAE